MLPKEGQLLRIFIGENDKYKSMPLYEWIIRKARSDGMAGATVLRGLEGFGANSVMHTAKILRLSQELPVIIELVDTKEKIQEFTSSIDSVIEEGLATIENIQIRFYRSSKKNV